jgi:hypothetical protein
MQKLSGRVRVGIGLALAGIFAYGTFLLFEATVVDHPVLMPVSLSAGEVKTPEFRIYESQFYNIGIEVKRRLPLEVLNCMLGISTGPLDPTNCGKRPLLQADWRLWSNGEIVGQGSSESHRGGGWGNDNVECVFGNFRGERGKKYVLVVNFEGDGASLAITDPHLKVAIGAGYDQTAIVTNLYFFALFIVLEAIAAIVLVSAALRKGRRAKPS